MGKNWKGAFHEPISQSLVPRLERARPLPQERGNSPQIVGNGERLLRFMDWMRDLGIVETPHEPHPDCGCVEGQPQRAETFGSAAAGAPCPSHSRAPRANRFVDWMRDLGIIETLHEPSIGGGDREQGSTVIPRNSQSGRTSAATRKQAAALLRWSFCLLLLVISGGLSVYGADIPSVRPFAHPDRIRYDSQCLTIDGKDVFIFSGAFHYFRCPKALWPERFQKIKEAGFNTVETYVPWNWCEREMPASTTDFSKVDLKDFDDWLNMAEQFGFYIIVRPGPYICSEWSTGGFPQWLLTKRPQQPLRPQGWLRSDDPVFLAWSEHWYDAVCPVIARHQITRKQPGQPGVILVQVENEYDFGLSFSDEAKENHLRTLVKCARADGIDVPLISCWTHQIRGQTDPLLQQVFDCCNFYPRWDVDGILPDIKKLRKEQPDAPLATTELQGGWFSQVGGKLSEDQDGVTSSQINNLTLFTIENGETMLNYYMLFGGTNPDDWAARDLTTSYDYNAPIREWGGVGDRYQAVRAIGLMLRKYGADLARSQFVHCNVNVSQNDVKIAERRAPNGGRFIFIRTSQHLEPRHGAATVKEEGSDSPEIAFNYELEPFGSRILYLPPGVNDPSRGNWLPEPAPGIRRPDASDLPEGVTITAAKEQMDPGPAKWRNLKPGETLAQAGVFDSHFIFYKAKVSCANSTNLLIEFPHGDSILAMVNGKPAQSVSDSGSSLIIQLPAGADTAEFLYENHGFANGGEGMEQQAGISRVCLTGSAIPSGMPITGWRMKVVTDPANRPEIGPDYDDSDWVNVAATDEDASQLTPNQTAVFRASVNLTDSDLNGSKVILRFGRIDDNGWLYVNGKLVGTTTDWARSYSFDATPESRPGRNEIVVVVQNLGGSGGIGMPSFSVDGAAFALKLLGRPAGDQKQWWAPGLDDSHWKAITIGEGAAASGDDSPLAWYRMRFTVPSARPGIWVPWRLHLAARGNGFLYLNGHPLGRYWDAGPQHDFFLPECWLQFGSDATNVLTLNLRPTSNGASIQSAAVEPYSEFAEER